MANFNLPHFGSLDPSDLEAYYDVEITFGGRPVEIDLNFDIKTIDPQNAGNGTAFHC